MHGFLSSANVCQVCLPSRGGATSLARHADSPADELMPAPVRLRSRISHAGGHAWSARLPKNLLWLANGPGSPRRSPVSLREDNLDLGPAHASVELIRQTGSGAYQLWED